MNNNQEWEKEFYQFFQDMYFRLERYEPDIPMLPAKEISEEIKSFISKVLSSEKEKLIKTILGEVEKSGQEYMKSNWRPKKWIFQDLREILQAHIK